MSAPPQILAILGHPTRKSFGGALADAYEQGASEAGCSVDVMDLSLMMFNATPTGRPGPLDEELATARERILRSDHIVLIYPTWLGAMPARMKGFFEQVFGNNWAFKIAPGALLPERMLLGRSADVLVTMDTPPLIYSWALGAPGHKLIKRAILAPSGISPVRLFSFGPLGTSTDAKRARWIASARNRGWEVGHALRAATLWSAISAWGPYSGFMSGPKRRARA